MYNYGLKLQGKDRKLVTASLIKLQAEKRFILGKKVKTLRKTGWTPVHLFGPGIESQALQVETPHLHKVLTESGRNRPISLTVGTDSDQVIVFVKDIQFHPLTSVPIHVDLIRVSISENTRVNIPLLITGDAPAVTELGGTISLELETILVECPPLETPESISVDISSLSTFESTIRAADISTPPGITIVTDGDQLIARALAPVTMETSSLDPAQEAEKVAETEETLSNNESLIESPDPSEEEAGNS